MKKLEDIEKQNNFKVPEGYFEDLEKQIADNISSERGMRSYVSGFQIFKPYIYMAACILFMVCFLKIFVTNVDNKEELLIPTSEAYEIDYIDNLINDDLVFYEYIEEIATETDQSTYSLDDQEYIEDYLAQYYIEYELFYE